MRPFTSIQPGTPATPGSAHAVEARRRSLWARLVAESTAARCSPGARTKARGFTLIELLVGLTILLVGILLAVFPALTMTVFNVNDAQQNAMAAEIAQNMFTQILIRPWGDTASNGIPVPTYAGNARCNPDPRTMADNDLASLVFRRIERHKTVYGVAYQISPLNFSGGTATNVTRRVDVQVFWDNARRCQIRRFSTILNCNRGDIGMKVLGAGNAMQCTVQL